MARTLNTATWQPLAVDPSTLTVRVTGLKADPATTVDTVTAAVDADGVDLPDRFDSVLVLEGIETGDGRMIEVGALSHRELPIPLMFQPQDKGHFESFAVGKIENIVKVDGKDGAVEHHANGSFDLGSEEGREAARMVRDQVVRWVSVDLEVFEWEFREAGDCADTDELPLLLLTAGDTVTADAGDPDRCRFVDVVVSGRIMGATVVPFPAFAGAVIVPEGVEIPAATDDGRPVVACAGPDAPPSDWFTDPTLNGPTRLTVTDDGEVYGHAAQWSRCHIGYQDRCLTAGELKSKTDYGYFHTGTIITDTGEKVAVGQLTAGCGHADLGHSLHDAQAHYDDGPGAFVWADVRVGEDEHGLWYHGSLRPGLTSEQVAHVRALAVSGDWRPVGSGNELVAITSVTVPGFPIVAAGRARMNEHGLVAAAGLGILTDTDCGCDDAVDLDGILDRLARVEAVTRELEPDARARVMENIRKMDSTSG